MKVLGVERDTTACNFYRILQPLYKLSAHQLADVMLIEEQDLGTPEAVDKVLQADVIVFQRPADENWFKFIKLCQKHGKIIVCDYDDDPFNTSPHNPYYKFVGTEEAYFKWPNGEIDIVWQDGVNIDIERNIMRQDMFRASFRKADMITCTTDILKGFFETLNPNTVVLPNLIDVRDYAHPEFVKKEVRIGYQCGASHYEDLYLIRDAIREVLDKNDNTKFIYFGDLRFRRLFQDIPQKRIEFHDWVKHHVYPHKLALLNLDIGLCPLVNNIFNRNKSAIKFFEYSAVGAATVASEIPPYQPVIRNGETGFLASDQKEWIDSLNELVRNTDRRQKMARAAFDCVYQEHNADKKAHLWRDAYQSLINKMENFDGNDVPPAAELSLKSSR